MMDEADNRAGKREKPEPGRFGGKTKRRGAKRSPAKKANVTRSAKKKGGRAK
jgi:hypothetical protein